MDVSPIILNTMPFDADLGCDLHYTYNGSQIYGYKILIYDNITNTLVQTVESLEQANTILDAVAKVPAGLLFNSNAYNFELYVKVKTRRTEKKTNPETNEEYEVIVEEEIYTWEEAISNAIEISKKKLLESNNKIVKIHKVEVLDKQTNNSKIKLNLFISAIEDITKIIEVKKLEEPTN